MHLSYRFHLPKTFLAKVNAWFGSGPYGHFSMEIGGYEYEATSRGFVKHLSNSFKKSDGDVYVFVLNDIQASTAIKILDGWAGEDGSRMPYNYAGILKFVFPWLKVRERGLFCSQAGYRLGRELDILPFVRKKKIDPTDLSLMIESIMKK